MSCLQQFVYICMQNISDTFLPTVHSIQDSINTGHSICYLQYTQSGPVQLSHCTCININKLIWAKKYMNIEKVTYLPVKFLQATATPTSPFVFIHFSRLFLKVNNSEFILLLIFHYHKIMPKNSTSIQVYFWCIILW